MKKLVIFLVLIVCAIALFLPGGQAPRKPVQIAEDLSNENQVRAPIESDLQTDNSIFDDDSDLIPIEEILKGAGPLGDTSSTHDQIGDAANAPGVIVYDRPLTNGYNAARDYENDEGLRGSYADGAGALEALREAGQLYGDNGNSGFYGGARVVNEVPTPIVPRVETAQPTPTAQATLKPVTGQARGYTMLYLMHPKARLTVERQVSAMIDSQVQNLYMGILVDGTFTIDYNYLQTIMRKIERAKRSLTLVLYLTNGTAMRDKSIPHLESPFSQFTPEEFRSLIQIDLNTRKQFVDIIQKALPILQLNKRVNSSNRNFVIVMLEDNLDDPSYLAMRTLASSIIGNRAAFLRNPCSGCVDGNTVSGFGDGIESHNIGDLETLGFSDSLTLDGQGYALPQETQSNETPYDEVNNKAITAASRGIRYFGLWRAARQGRVLGQAAPVPNERIYEVPTAADLQAEITLLRAGLTEVQ